MHFVGIDLGWKMDPPRERGTGVCIVDEHGCTELALVTTDEEILAAIPEGDCWVAVDAPLRVKNLTGTSGTEMTIKGMGIPVMPTSRRFMVRFGGCRGEVLAKELRARGFGFTRGGRWMVEAYPHGVAHVLLAGKVPRYKRGIREGMAKARKEVLEAVAAFEPSLQLPDLSHSSHDLVDAVLSVVCIYSHWLNSGQRTRVIGKGIYMVLPRGAIV
jgi:predicted RNase H-like nuclease